jgi:hypothetical protein
MHILCRHVGDLKGSVDDLEVRLIQSNMFWLIRENVDARDLGVPTHCRVVTVDFSEHVVELLEAIGLAGMPPPAVGSA